MNVERLKFCLIQVVYILVEEIESRAGTTAVVVALHAHHARILLLLLLWLPHGCHHVGIVVHVPSSRLLWVHIWHRRGSSGCESWGLVKRGSGLGLGHVSYAGAEVRLTRLRAAAERGPGGRCGRWLQWHSR